MKQARGSLRRLFMQSLECRCVMDASGFEMGTEGLQDCDLGTAAIVSHSASGEGADETSTGDDMGDDNSVDAEMVKRSSFDDADTFDADTFDATAASDGADDVDPSIFQTFGAPTQDDDGMIEAASFHGIAFNFDIDQSGSLSRLDAEMIISYLSEYIRSENSIAFAQSNSNGLLQMDVDGDSMVTPLDALIVINELNRTGALDGFATSDSNRLSNNSTLIAGDMVDDTSTDSADVSTDDTSDVSSKMSVARMTDLAMTDFASSTEASKIAFFKSLSATKKDGTPFFISVDDNGKVSAVADSQDLEVSIDEDHLISVENESTGLAVVDVDGEILPLHRRQ